MLLPTGRLIVVANSICHRQSIRPAGQRGDVVLNGTVLALGVLAREGVAGEFNPDLGQPLTSRGRRHLLRCVDGYRHAARTTAVNTSATDLRYILPTMDGRAGLKLFCSYSHHDESLWAELSKHLKLLERQGLVATWYDRQIGAGDLWRQAIDRNLQEADIILLLISADFLASDYCFDIEMKTALERHAAEEALVVPVILRPVDWRGTPFREFQSLPRDGKPITTFANPDVAFEQVAAGLRAAIENRLKTRRGQNAVSPEVPPEMPPPPPKLPAGSVDPIVRLLALYIGPIASVVVRQAALSYHGPQELCEAVSVEIPHPEDRSRFLSEARKLDHETA